MPAKSAPIHANGGPSGKARLLFLLSSKCLRSSSFRMSVIILTLATGFIFLAADAVMLSGETAVGKHPAKVIQSMARICVEAEKQSTAMQSSHRLHTQFGRVDEAIAMASMYTANHLGVAAIASLTESGSTALWMSRISSGIPIYAMTEHVATRRRVTLYRGVYPISFQPTESDSQRINQEVVEELLRRGAVRDGDLVIITKGDFQGIPGGTNVMKILRVGEHILPD